MRLGKTIWGALGFGICSALSVVFPPAAVVLVPLKNSVFLPLIAVGLGHKLDRVTAKLPPLRL